ncbi:FtsX-like permease family protein [Congregibacter variabilis]|uniref:FtsX-like permease family protein n=1 Tax=Congregibacter variabilis TaxID=3081200 RepID=A0ABZ0HZ61_9GAMM|nr:FtsX-like permease family protein [Congregibacter sp. IMCC43200]
MSISWVLAWRNLWRHRRRTWLTVGAMILCNILLVGLISLQFGVYAMMIDNMLGSVTGHLQIQHPEYLEDERMRQTVPRATEWPDKIAQIPGVRGVTVRATGFALAAGTERSFGIRVVGVQPAGEPTVSSLPGLVKQGRYLKDGSAAEAVIGARLAENLKVTVDDELVLLGSGRDGSVAASIATIVGIIESGFPEVDQTLAQVPLAFFDDTFSMRGEAHSVVIRLDALNDLDSVAANIQILLPSGDSLALRTWEELQPGLKQAIKSDLVSAWFMYAVLIVLVALSVLNTQLMSVLERTHEFGVMLALGLSPGRLARLVGMETCLLGALGLVIGLSLGLALTWYLSVHGFTYPGMEELAARFNLSGRMYPQVSVLTTLWGPLTVFVGVLLAAVYPALLLFRLRPVEAMQAV